MRRASYIIVCLFFAITGLHGQQPLSFHHLTTENGLLNNSVISLAQDSTGFMWFGTISGLSRYDGARFKNYTFKEKEKGAVPFGVVNYLYCDAEKNLWAATSAGIKIYNEKKDIFETIPFLTDSSQVALSIFEDSRKNIWAGAAHGLYLLKKNSSKKVFEKFSVPGANIPSGYVRSIFEDSRKNVWVGSVEGLSRLRAAGNTWHLTNFYAPSGLQTNSTNAYAVTTIAEDAFQNIWIGTQGKGVFIFNSQTQTFSNISHLAKNNNGLINNNVRVIINGPNGKMWVGTQEGLTIIDPVTMQMQSYQNDVVNKNSLSKNSIYSLLQDNNGSVWIGIYYGGVNCLYAYNTSFNVLQNTGRSPSLNNNVISSVAEDANSNVWIGTEGGGINFLNRKTGAISFYKNQVNNPGSLGSNLVRSLYFDKAQNLWCGTHGGGLNVLPKGSSVFQRYLFNNDDPASFHREIFSIAEDNEGRMWVATSEGLRLFKKEGIKLTPIPIENISGYENGFIPVVLFTGRDGDIWIGGEPGLYVVHNNRVSKISWDFNVVSLHEDAAGNIWACLNYQGLARYDKNKKQLVIYSKKDGLPTNTYYGMLEDDENNFWVSSNIGLVKFNPASKKSHLYTVSDGLAGNDFNVNSVLKDSKGEFFFGSFDGVVSFSPGKIETNKYSAPVVFTGLRLFNNELFAGAKDGILTNNINHADVLTFNHSQNVISIEFALLNFIKSNKNTFAYKLQGFDADWNITQNTFATYTNLSPGNYTFWVKGANNDGLWSEPVSLQIKVLPPFWRTWWAYIFYALALLSLVFFITRYFFLQELFKKEDALHQVKLNFFTNMSHEIRTHLSLIMAPIENLLNKNNNNRFLSQQLTQVKTNADRLLNLVNELMDFRKAETNHLKMDCKEHDLIPFLQKIYDSFRETSLSKNIHVSFIHNADAIPVYFDEKQLEKVFFNLMTNAFKFTEEGGRINLIAERKKGEVLVKVLDNGRGIDPEYIDNIFDNFFQVPDYEVQNTGYGIGLALSKSIIDQHSGTIDVECEPAKNGDERRTVFTVKLPLEHKAWADGAEDTAQVSMALQNENHKPLNEGLPVAGTLNDTLSLVLLVEDNAELRAVIKEVFNKEYRVMECENGLQGWQAAIENIPDIIVSDVMMPEMDGFELCTKLKTDARTSHVPVILLTAKTAQNDQVEGLETGADQYITKPFSTKILELSVRNFLTARERLWAKFTQQIATPVKTEDLYFYKSNMDKEFLMKLTQMVEEHIEEEGFGVEMLSRKIAMSAPVLYKKLKAVTGLTVNDFIKNQRLQKAAQLLTQGDYTVSEAAFSVGYNDTKYFSREFKKKFGKTPSGYGKGAN